MGTCRLYDCDDPRGIFGGMDWILENWAQLLLAAALFIDVVVSITPTKKDDAAWGYLRLVINALTGNTKRNQKKQQKNGDH